MISFDPQNPYPLLSLQDSQPRANANEHARAVDAWLGLETETTEALIQKSYTPKPNEQHWIGLPVQTLLTPYTEIREMLHHLNPQPGQSMIDLGAGYGRMAFVLATHHPGVRFVGYEVIAERVREGQRALALINNNQLQLLQADLTAADFTLPGADFYFLYDYGTRKDIQMTLDDLRLISQKRTITVIGRGRASRDAIEQKNPWLSQVVSPEHRGNYSIYRSA